MASYAHPGPGSRDPYRGAPGAASGPLPGPHPDEVVNAEISILVVDDEQTLRDSCASLLQSEGFQVTVASRGEEGLKRIRNQKFDIALVDLYMPDLGGMEVLQGIRETSPDTLVILMTGKPSVEHSIQGLRAGAWDYVPKPFSASHLHILIGRAAHAVTVARESRERSRESDSISTGVGRARLIGRSEQYNQVVELARKVARSDASVFITGESGAGKELIAHFIHENSRRSSRRMVCLNCAAIPESLLESEMFGHVEGAFTGAVRDKTGLLEEAHGGTMFLDELPEMPLTVQAKLLRVIQDGVIRKVGSSRTDSLVNVRFIAATNADPSEMVREGRLRKDLLYRLRVVPIRMPALRERKEDIPLLAKHFLGELWQAHRMPDEPAPTLSEAAVDALTRRPWRGNVRELRNVIEHVSVMAAPGSEIGEDDIPELHEPVDWSPGDSLIELVAGSEYHEARERLLSMFEKEYVEYVIRAAGGVVSDAARMAGVDRTTLYRLMEKHGTSKVDILTRSGD